MARRRRKGKGSRSAQPNTVHPEAAGLDLGSTEVYAAVRPERDPDPIRNFASISGRSRSISVSLGWDSLLAFMIRALKQGPRPPPDLFAIIR